MIASSTASSIFLLTAALGSTTNFASAASNNISTNLLTTKNNNNNKRNLQFSGSDFSLPDLDISDLDIPDPSSFCNDSDGDASREAICTILDCIDLQTGAFTCLCSVVVDAVKQIDDTQRIIPGTSDDFLDEIVSCCPSSSKETSPVDFSMCMLGCNETPEDPVCDLLECMDPISGKFTCVCNVVTNALGMIPGGGEAAAVLGVTDDVVEKADACCSQDTALGAFQKCFDDIEVGLLLPFGNDDADASGGTTTTDYHSTPTLEDVTGSDEAPVTLPTTVVNFDASTEGTPSDSSTGTQSSTPTLVDATGSDEAPVTLPTTVGSEETPSDSSTGTQSALPTEGTQGIPSSQEDGTQNTPSNQEEADGTDPTSGTAGWGSQYVTIMAVLLLALAPVLYV